MLRSNSISTYRRASIFAKEYITMQIYGIIIPNELKHLNVEFPFAGNTIFYNLYGCVFWVRATVK